MIFLIIGLTLILAFDVYFIISKQKENCLSERINQKKLDTKFFQSQVSNLYANDLNEIKKCSLFYNRKPCILDERTIDKAVLVLRFSLFNCSACVDFSLGKLKQNFNDFITNDKIILLYDDINMRVTESMFGKMPYVTKEKYALGLPVENSNVPFMFILDSEMMVKHFFVPEKGMPELTDEYLKIIKKRYFNNDLEDKSPVLGE